MKTAEERLREQFNIEYVAAAELYFLMKTPLFKIIRVMEEYSSEKDKEIERLKKALEALAPKNEVSKVADPDGYVTSAAKILHALNLTIGVDVNEFAMPVIAQIIKNNVLKK